MARMVMPGHHLAGLDRERSHRHCGWPIKKPLVRNGANRKDVRRLRIDDGCPNNDAQADCEYQYDLQFFDFHGLPFFICEMFLIEPGVNWLTRCFNRLATPSQAHAPLRSRTHRAASLPQGSG